MTQNIRSPVVPSSWFFWKSLGTAGLSLPSLTYKHQHIVTRPVYIPVTTTKSMDYSPSVGASSSLAGREIPLFLSVTNINFYGKIHSFCFLTSLVFLPSRHSCYMASPCILLAVC